jgi:hypothetical protein
MFSNAIENLISFDINTIGLIFGFIGAIILTVFGLPPISLLNEGSYVEIVITPKMKRNMWLSRLGLLFIAIGFLMQLSAVPAAF